VPYDRARGLVEAAVPQRIEAWAEIVQLTTADVRFDRFREDVTEALHACMRAHIATPYRFRWSDIGEDFGRVAEEARAVAMRLRKLRAAFDKVAIWLRDPDPMFKHLPLQSVSDLEALANEADRRAEVCSDEGGRPEYVAFAVLAAGLMRALEHATGAVDVASAALVALVDAVLVVAQDVAKQSTGERLEEPNSQDARRRYLRRMSPDRLRRFAEMSGLVDKT